MARTTTWYCDVCRCEEVSVSMPMEWSDIVVKGPGMTPKRHDVCGECAQAVLDVLKTEIRKKTGDKHEDANAVPDSY